MYDVAPLVFIVDDDPSVRRSLARLLKSAGYDNESFSSAGEFLRRDSHPGPSCIVLDIRMPGSSGLELRDNLLKRTSRPPIIFLTGHGDVSTSVNAMKQGALDFLTKPVNDDDLLDAICRGLAKDSNAIAARGKRDSLQKRITTLTPREEEVYRLVVTGMLNKQIASKLGISEKTVKVHRGRVMRKMQVSSFAELVRTADDDGIH